MVSVMKKRLLAILLMAVMALTFAPLYTGAAFADEEADETEAEAVETETAETAEESDFELQNIRMEGDFIFWDEPENAAYYVLMEEITTDHPAFNIGSYFDEQYDMGDAAEEEYYYIIAAYDAQDNKIAESEGFFTYDHSENEDLEPVKTVHYYSYNHEVVLGEKPEFTGEGDDRRVEQYEGINDLAEVWMEEPTGDVIDVNSKDVPEEGKAYIYAVAVDLNKGYTINDDVTLYYNGTRYTKANGLKISKNNPFPGKDECNAVYLYGFFPAQAFGIPIENCDFEYSDEYAYTGSAIVPKVSASYEGLKLEEGVDFTVKAKESVNVGDAEFVVEAKGDKFTGKDTLLFSINPKGTMINQVMPLKKGIMVSWESQPDQITGYQIRYSTDRDMEDAEKVTVKGTDTLSKELPDLMPRKTYFVQVRTYTKIGDDKYYSSWSTKEAVQTN